jgi:hypothetical protein
MRAAGEFDVRFRPLGPAVEGTSGMRLERTAIDKTFRGDLTGRSRVEMLSAKTDIEGSMGYAALEYVEGALHGKTGTFVLQHFGIMDRGAQRLILEVVPDSGTGQLANLLGSMTITVEGDRHRYEFDYSFR